MSFYLAVDAGGTKTDYLLATDTEVLGRVQSGTIKRMRVDADRAARNLDEGLGQLTAATGLAMTSITRTCIGASGDSVPLVVNWLRAAFADRVTGDLIIAGDVEIALDAAFPGQPGILVLAGTGSNVAGRAHSGKVTTVGGWGPALADQGSGHRIGSEALRAIFSAIDASDDKLLDPSNASNSPTTLIGEILSFWKLSSIAHLVELANGTPAPDFSSLTGCVLACANEGDAVAREVLEREGKSLADLIRIAIRRLQRESPDPGWTPPVAFAGSILANVTPLRDAMLAGLRQDVPGLIFQPEPVDPLEGALWRVRLAP